ncbi:S41 family peptidase [Sphingomonas jaspsi]|uniref:S41 family peptidase n=1 Tax=Sphingomonas jaspsi TaxID=392409 RepID=UPI0004B2611A|nr:S41 family peptidase [Sphingomonas jaspsi]
MTKSRLSNLLPPLALVGALSLVPIATTAMAASESNTQKELETFFSVFERVRENYVDKVDDHTLIKGAIDGMLSALDPHSSYAEAADFAQLRTTTEGNYGGLGLTVSTEDGAVKVIAPTEDSPADRAGVKAGDYITHIDGEFLYGYSLDEAVDKMRGKPGTTVKLTIVRPGRDAPFDVKVTREKIELKPVKWEVKDNVGVININGFSANTGALTREALISIDQATGGKATGYIIDLRNNPGGLLDQAVEVSDAFLEQGEVVSERGRDPSDIERFYAKPGDLSHGKPIIILVDAGTASAAEIVAGALQDHRRAIVMGERSFGKGSVQSVVQMGPQAALRLTTARYYTPSGRSVQAGGIDPDIAVPQLSDPDFAKKRPRLREADLRRHLLSQANIKDDVLEEDTTSDPRFTATAEELEKKGVKDFQLDYALKTLKRLAPPAAAPAKVATR